MLSNNVLEGNFICEALLFPYLNQRQTLNCYSLGVPNVCGAVCYWHILYLQVCYVKAQENSVITFYVCFCVQVKVCYEDLFLEFMQLV